MGKINGCLKCIFIFFNVLYAILGCGLIYAAVKAAVIGAQASAVGGPSPAWLWVFAIGMLGISCLGIFAGCSEKDLALKIFAGFMGAGLIIMLIFGIYVVVFRNKLKNAFQTAGDEYVKPYMANDDFKGLLDGFQQSAQCCGVGSASDWGDDIPPSCECTSGSAVGFGLGYSCVPRPQGSKGPEKVYDRSCGDVMFVLFDFFLRIAMGFFFGFAVTALLGLLVTLLMIHQVKRHDSSGGASIAMKGY